MLVQNNSLIKLLLLSLTAFIAVSAHGRLITPLPRILNTGYENDPVTDNGSLRATDGNDWICRRENPTAPQMTLSTGTVANFEYRLTARHVGDCDFSISYDWSLPLEEMQWFKIANIPNCKDQGSMIAVDGGYDLNRVDVTMPSWLKSGRAVLRWGWWGIHNWPSVEFFVQCADVNIQGVSALPLDLQTYTLPGVYPKDANDGIGYRNEYAGEKYETDAFWMTGPACAMDSDLNNCLLTAPGTLGNIPITSFPTTSMSTSTSTTTSTSTPISTTTANCASQIYNSKASCVSNETCQQICAYDNGSLCPLQICECAPTTTSTTSSLLTTVSTSMGSTTYTSTSTSSTSTSTSTSTATSSTAATSSTTSTATSSTTSTSQPISTSLTQGGDQVRICYFQNWGRYWPAFGGEDVFEKGLDPTLCTHIQYGFVTIEDVSWDLKAFDPNADFPGGNRDSPCPLICVPGYVHDWSSGSANPCEWPCTPDRKRRGFDGMLKLKEQNPDIKLIASVGGWNFNDCEKTDQANTGAFTCHMFSTIASTEANSRAHALKVIDFLRHWGFDGYDVDWEYPVAAKHNNVDMQSRPADFVNYIRFLEILKEEFAREASEANDGRARLLLTAAVGVGKPTVDESYDIPAMNDVLDLISLMTYDMNGAWEPTTTNFNAPLHATSADITLKGYPLSVEWAVDYWLAGGASADKLVLGMATYGRGWTLASSEQGQGALSAANGPAAAGSLTQMEGYLSYFEIQELIANGATEYWDSERKVPYIITADGSEWHGYDDVQSLTLKTNLLMSKGLRGAMFWALELDDVHGTYSNAPYPLMNAVKATMSGYRADLTSSSSTSSASTTLLTSTTSSTSTTASSTSSEPTSTTSASTSSTTTSTSALLTTMGSTTSSSQPSTAVNLIGYYGNSGSCDASGCTPTFSEIPDAYNVIIMTFLNIDDSHNLQFQISSYAPVQLADLATEITNWKSSADPWGRRKMVLVSLGGQNGHWPATITDAEVVTKLGDFMRQHNLDGLDIDFESSAIQFVEKNIAAFLQLKSEGFVLSAAPEAAQGPLTAYRPILADLDWVHPQFYNNPPNAVTVPFVPQFENQATWQSPADMPWWLVTMDTTANLVGMTSQQRGIAIPATPLAAGNNNQWDLNLLAAQIRVGDIRNVATWALGYDKENGWALANVIAALNDQDLTSTTSTSSAIVSTDIATTTTSTSTTY